MSPSYKFGLLTPRFSVEELQVFLIVKFRIFHCLKGVYSEKSYMCEINMYYSTVGMVIIGRFHFGGFRGLIIFF